MLLISCYHYLGTGNAFVVHPRTAKVMTFRTTFLSAEGTDNRKRRVRRKSPEESSNPEVEEQQTSNYRDFQPRREDTGVSLKVTDVRDLVSGKSTSTASTTTTSSVASPVSYKSPTKAAATTTATTTKASISGEPSNPLDDSLQQLLLDAREMQDKSASTTDSNNSEDGVSSKIRNAISTLVTVDFFVVCLFLLWFLAGIFCSAVFKDDTVQIAFNSNFQQLVQPALGILMIAAVADAVFKQKEDDEM